MLRYFWQDLQAKRVLGCLVAWTACVLLANQLCSRSAVADPLYVIRSSRGVITFTSRKPAGGDFQTLAQEPKRQGSFSFYKLRRWSRNAEIRAKQSEYDDLITRTAAAHELDPALVKAVVHVESAFNAGAVSNKGAMGLMQLMPGTARRFGVRNAFEPAQNVLGGVRYLAWLLERYSGNLRFALAAYNAGEGAVDQYGEVPPYSETQDYVRKVLSTHKVYRVARANKQGGKGSA